MADNNLFSEFPPISKAEWLNQIAKDLKDRSLHDFEWRASGQLQVSPFVHADDFATSPQPLFSNVNHWEICETIRVDAPGEANRIAMEALNGGAEGLQFEWDNTPELTEMEQLLNGIHLDFIGLHFSGSAVAGNPSTFFSHLLQVANSQKIPTNTLKGSIRYAPLQSVGPIVDWRYMADLLEFSRDTFPSFKMLTVDVPEEDDTVAALADAIATGNEYIQKLSERGVAVSQVAACLQFSVSSGKSYFLEIAKIRALKLLWINILKGWNTTLAYPSVSVHFRPEAYTDDLYSNMIRATTMAMSAVNGGADRLIVMPYDEGRESQSAYPAAFGRRVARNVQHLMKMESHLDEIADPAAGSYYIENLTLKLAEKAWALFASAT